MKTAINIAGIAGAIAILLITTAIIWMVFTWTPTITQIGQAPGVLLFAAFAVLTGGYWLEGRA
jgi:hypothetical protein